MHNRYTIYGDALSHITPACLLVLQACWLLFMACLFQLKACRLQIFPTLGPSRLKLPTGL